MKPKPKFTHHPPLGPAYPPELAQLHVSGALEDVALQQCRGGPVTALTAAILTGPQQQPGPFEGAQPQGTAQAWRDTVGSHGRPGNAGGNDPVVMVGHVGNHVANAYFSDVLGFWFLVGSESEKCATDGLEMLGGDGMDGSPTSK